MERKGRYIPNELTNKRWRKSLRQQEVAAILGITQNQLSLWEAGKASPNLDHLVDLCVYLNSDLRGLYPDLFQAALLRIATNVQEAARKNHEEKT